MHIPKVLLAVLLLACSTSSLVSSSAVSYCEDTPYYQTNSVCCGDKLHSRGLNTRCCKDSGEVYNAARQVCCGTVQDVSWPWSMGCCKKNGKSTLYNRSNQACCMGNLHNTKTQFELPSGQVIEEDTKGFCCGTSYVDTTYNDDYSMTCCRDPEYPALSKPYNISQNVCCGGNVQPRSGMDQCCGRHTYNPQEEVCCFPNDTATIYPAIGYGPNQCCAKAPGGVISQSTHVCINDEPYERQCFPQSYTSPTSTLGCCAGYLKYNKTTHHCCGVRVLPHGTECCRGQPVLEGQVCCGPDHGAVTVSNPGDNSCCYRPAFWQTYNNSTQTCRYGLVTRRVLCGGRRYNPAKKSCCRDILSDTKCCAGEPVLKGQVCCGPAYGVVTVSNPADNACCYSAASYNTYDKTTHTCRHGVVKQRMMCGGQTFNPAKMLCCEGHLYQRMKGYMCCGRRVYTPKYLTCCNGQRIQGAKRQCPQ